MPILASILIGKRYGEWTVTGLRPRRHLECSCSCGTFKPVDRFTLRRGLSKSCGCVAAAKTRARMTRHGHSVGHGTLEYSSWCAMKYRCSRRSAHQWVHYGGRGIKVCERWMNSFESFLSDMGPRPTIYHTIERLDNDGNYEPGNCVWALKKQQARNTRRNKFITANGQTKTVAEWSEITGIEPRVLHSRLSMGWSHHDTITRPARVLKNKQPK